MLAGKVEQVESKYIPMLLLSGKENECEIGNGDHGEGVLDLVIVHVVLHQDPKENGEHVSGVCPSH